jgi:hypothetical protein
MMYSILLNHLIVVQAASAHCENSSYVADV